MKENTDFVDAIRDLMNVDADDVESLKESIIENVEMSNFSLDCVKTFKKQTADILNNLKKGFIEEEMIVYYMDDRTTGKMLIYLENGNFYEERPFTDGDMQGVIKMVS